VETVDGRCADLDVRSELGGGGCRRRHCSTPGPAAGGQQQTTTGFICHDFLTQRHVPRPAKEHRQGAGHQQGTPFIADRTNGRAYSTMLRLSVVCL